MKTFAVCFALMCVVVAFSSAYPSPKRGSKVPPILQGYVGFIDIIPTKEDPNLENEVEIYRPSSFIMEDIILPEKVSGKAAPNMPGGRIIDFE